MTLDGDIVANDDAKNPYKVVFRDGSDILAEWPVDSLETGHRRMESAMLAISLRSIETAQANSDALVDQERLSR